MSADRNGSCTCFISAPCTWCESLDEEEMNAIWGGGWAQLEALWAHRDAVTNGVSQAIQEAGD